MFWVIDLIAMPFAAYYGTVALGSDEVEECTTRISPSTPDIVKFKYVLQFNVVFAYMYMIALILFFCSIFAGFKAY